MNFTPEARSARRRLPAAAPVMPTAAPMPAAAPVMPTAAPTFAFGRPAAAPLHMRPAYMHTALPAMRPASAVAAAYGAFDFPARKRMRTQCAGVYYPAAV